MKELVSSGPCNPRDAVPPPPEGAPPASLRARRGKLRTGPGEQGHPRCSAANPSCRSRGPRKQRRPPATQPPPRALGLGLHRHVHPAPTPAPAPPRPRGSARDRLPLAPGASGAHCEVAEVAVAAGRHVSWPALAWAPRTRPVPPDATARILSRSLLVSPALKSHRRMAECVNRRFGG